MLQDKAIPGRTAPISFQEKEDFQNLNPEYFFLCQMTSGFVVVKINSEIFYLSSNTLFCFPRGAEIEVLASYKVNAMSVSFAPEFANVNLNWDLIESEIYPSIVEEFNYPSFHLFYKHNTLYKGVLPLNHLLANNLMGLFREMIRLLKDQPHSKWSCEVRTNLFLLLETAEYFCDEFRKGDASPDSLTAKLRAHIALHLFSKIRIEDLCQLFHTNHTTIHNKFKAEIGVSIGDYIVQKRLMMAKYYLAFTKLSVEQIAEKIGYNNPSCFITLFKKHVGMTPLNYRTEMRNKRANASPPST